MRWILRALSLAITLAVLAALTLALIPGKKLAELAAARIELMTGREVTLSGDVKTKLFPRLSVSTGPITIANADWAETAPMLTAEGLSVGVQVLPLFRGNLEIRNIEVLQPNIRLEVAKNGRRNWDLEGNSTAPEEQTTIENPVGAKTARNISVTRAEITGADVLYVNHATGLSEVFQRLDVSLQLPHAKEATLRASGLYKGALFDAATSVAEPMAFLDGKVSQVSLRADVDGSKLTYIGKAGLDGLVLEGVVEATSKDVPALMSKFGMAVDGLQGPVSVRGGATRTADGRMFLREGVIQVFGQEITGDFDLSMGKERPHLKGVIRAQDLDFTRAEREKTASVPSAPTSGGWSTDTIDASGLFAMDAEISLQAASIQLGKSMFGDSRVLLKLDNGRAVFDLRNLSTYGGALSGEFVANGRGGLSVGGDLRLTDVETGPMFDALAGNDRLDSTATASLKFLGVGNSVDALMKSLKGQGEIAIGKGALKGVDVVQMIRNLDLGYQGEGQRTVFESVTGSYVIEGGILRNQDLVLSANGVTAKGAGEINIGAQSLEYRLTPTAFTQADGGGAIAVPLMISGPWSNIKYGLDMDALLKQELAQENAALQAQVVAAREAAKAKAAKDLGIEQAEGESLEDAARRSFEDAAKNELLKLLGGN
jgi:AsmA protein